MGELFGNIALASAMTAGIIGASGCAIKVINIESKIGDVVLWIAAFFAGITGLSSIIYVWWLAVFRGL